MVGIHRIDVIPFNGPINRREFERLCGRVIGQGGIRLGVQPSGDHAEQGSKKNSP
jgi:hypothetical protein